MAGSAMSVHTRVVPARRRADSRAATEPRAHPARRPGADEAVQPTTPYQRDFSPEGEDRSAKRRDSVPYCELEVVTDCQSPPGNLVVPSLDGTTERDLPPPSELFAQSSDVWTIKRPKAVETSKVSTIRRDKPQQVETANVPTLERGRPARAKTEKDATLEHDRRGHVETANVPTLERDRRGHVETANVPTLERGHVETANIPTLEHDKRGHAETANVPTLEHDRRGHAETANAPTLERGRPARVETSNVSTIKTERRRLGRGSGAQPKRGDVRPPLLKATLSWLGVAVAQPVVGAPLVIGTWLSPEFRVTSPVTRLIERPDGVLVQTATNSRYLVKPAGDAFLVGAKR